MGKRETVREGREEMDREGTTHLPHARGEKEEEEEEEK